MKTGTGYTSGSSGNRLHKLHSRSAATPHSTKECLGKGKGRHKGNSVLFSRLKILSGSVFVHFKGKKPINSY